MFEQEKALRTVMLLKGTQFSSIEAAEVFNDLPGPSQCTVHGILRKLRKEAKIEYIETRDRIKYYEVVE